LGSLVGGVISSRIRWKRSAAQRLPFLLGMLTVGTVAVANLWEFGLGWLAAALFLAGLALAPTFAACYAVIGDVSPVQRRTEAFAWGGTCMMLGLGSGPVLGGVLAETSPTLTFLAGTIATVVALAVWLILNPRRT
jgi:MFS family permease